MRGDGFSVVWALGSCWGAGLYEQLEKFDWYYQENKWEFIIALDLIKESRSVFEVGTGRGHFLGMAAESGLSVQGVELNPKAAEWARSRGFRIFEETLDKLFVKKHIQVDAVCSFQVLEHVANPREFIEQMFRLLRPGGKLILSVPNAEVMQKIDPDNLELLNQPPHHMGHWEEGVFRALEDFLPLKIKSVHKEPLANVHIGWMVNNFLRNRLALLGKKIPRILINRYSTLPIQCLLRLGLRRFFPGHTLLIEFEYQP